MTGFKIFVPIIIAFLLIMGLYLKFKQRDIEGNYYDESGWGWQHTAMSGNFILSLSAVFLALFLYALKRNKK